MAGSPPFADNREASCRYSRSFLVSSFRQLQETLLIWIISLFKKRGSQLSLGGGTRSRGVATIIGHNPRGRRRGFRRTSSCADGRDWPWPTSTSYRKRCRRSGARNSAAWRPPLPVVGALRVPRHEVPEHLT